MGLNQVSSFFCFMGLLAAVVVGVSSNASAQDPPPPATDAEIVLLISQLSDTSYARRVGATRRLCAIGASAAEALRHAVDGEDTEAALRARRVLTALDRVWFSGIEVRLEADRTTFEWNQPIELRLVLENRSRFAARIPFESGSDQSETNSADARQVALMIDASDWLVVKNERGREIDLHVDEISDDKAVWQVIQDRLRGGPSCEVAPGERRSVVLSAFNRGWARYPLLESGRYTIQFQYVPEWLDPVLAEDKVGEVASNVLTLEVLHSAPAGVTTNGAPAEVSVRREAGDLIATLTNRHDHDIVINTNYGVSAPFAEINWVYERDGRRTLIPAMATPGRQWSEFDAKRFVLVESGGSIDLVRRPVGDVVDAFKQAGENLSGGEGSISVSYFNLCDRQWQLREQASLEKDADTPEVLRSPLPRQVVAARLTSGSLRWTAP